MPPRRPLELDEDTYAQVLAEAEREDRPPTSMLRRLVQEALKERTRRRKPKSGTYRPPNPLPTTATRPPDGIL